MLQNITFSEFISESNVINEDLSQSEIINEGVVENVAEIFKLLSTKYKYPSTWTNKSKSSLIIDSKNTIISNGNKYSEIKKSRFTDKNDLKIISSFIKKSKDERMIADFESDNVILWMLRPSMGSDLILNFTQRAESGYTYNEFVKTDKFLFAMHSLGVNISWNVNVGINYDSMQFNKEKNRLEIKTSVPFLSLTGTETNTIAIREHNEFGGVWCNIHPLSTNIKLDDEKLQISEKLQKFLSKFKVKEFEKLFDTTFSTLVAKQVEENLVKDATQQLVNEIGTSNYDLKTGYVSIKRWDKLNFIFDLDNVTSADWAIERTLDKKSIVFLDKLVQKIEKQFKNKIRIQWLKEEKWNVSFKVSKI